MKRCFSVVISIVIAISSMLAFSACTQEDSITEPTDTLVIYGTDAANELNWGPALTAYKQLYPDVTIDYREFSVDEFQEYSDLLRTELAAGKGPDLIVTSALNSPISLPKATSSGAFFDINLYLENDDTFSLDGYHEAAMEAGVYDGKRLFVPLSYTVQPIVTTEENLDALGVEWNSSMSFWDIVEQADASKADVFFHNNLLTDLFFPSSGFTLVDFKNKTIHVDADEFRSLMEIYKESYYAADYSNYIDPSEGFRSIQNNQAYFVDAPYMGIFAVNALALAKDQNLLVMPMNKQNPVGEIDLLAWINQGSENKVNAYNMLKVLLSESYQKKLSNMPVLQSLSDKSIKTQILDYQNTYLESYDVYLGEFTEEQLESIKNIYNEVTFNQNNEFYVSYIILQSMEPYFKDEKDYESCLAELENKLRLYMNE